MGAIRNIRDWLRGIIRRTNGGYVVRRHPIRYRSFILTGKAVQLVMSMYWFDPISKVTAVKRKDDKIRIFNQYGEELRGIGDIRITETIDGATSITFDVLPNSHINF
jgi:hypothetical protein